VAVDASGNIYFADMQNSRIRKVSTTGIITTVAGNGSPGYSGDGGPATAAQLNVAADVAVDTGGNLYIADQFNRRIRKVATSGIITTVAGNGSRGYFGDGGPATAAGLVYPNGVAVDATGNLYIADDNRILKVSTSGIITTVAGDGIPGFSGDGGAAINSKLDSPWKVAVDASGDVYAASLDLHSAMPLSIPTARIPATARARTSC
jgi:sugar lactone lactonase YvrE